MSTESVVVCVLLFSILRAFGFILLLLKNVDIALVLYKHVVCFMYVCALICSVIFHRKIEKLRSKVDRYNIIAM